MQLTQNHINDKFSNRTLEERSARLAGYTAVGGTVIMLIGAVLWATSQTDLWVALQEGDIAGYLAAVEPVQAQLVANLSVWILGVLTLGVAGAQLAAQCTQRPEIAAIGRIAYQIAVPLVVVSYITMMAPVVLLAGDTSETAVAIGEVVGWIGVRADDLATALMIGAGPLMFALAGRGEWVTPWLERLGYLCGALGLFSLAVLYTPLPIGLSFLILPAGMIWHIWAGVILLRR